MTTPRPDFDFRWSPVQPSPPTCTALGCLLKLPSFCSEQDGADDYRGESAELDAPDLYAIFKAKAQKQKESTDTEAKRKMPAEAKKAKTGTVEFGGKEFTVIYEALIVTLPTAVTAGLVSLTAIPANRGFAAVAGSSLASHRR